MDEIVYRDNNSRFLTSEEVDQNFDFLSRSLRVPVIATVADIVATKFASSFSSIYVAQYSATSGAKSGAHYVRVAAQPAHALAFQDALGQWWEIDVADIWAEQAGAVGDNVTLNHVAFQAALTAASVRGGGTVRFGSGVFRLGGQLSIASNVRLIGSGVDASELVVTTALASTSPAIINATNSSDGSLTNTGIVLADFTFRNERAGAAWLSKADGTLIVDPSADYLPGGCLAPATQPTVTLTLTSGVITGAVVSGVGAGVNYPVAIWVTGDGRYANLQGNIAAGQLASVTIANGGSGYTTATAVVAGGGADPVTALYAADRRNASYSSGSGVAIQLTTCDSPLIRNIKFKSFGSFGVVSDRGCDNLVVDQCQFLDCGQSDYVGCALWAQSYGTPGAGQPYFRFSTNTKFINSQVLRHLRSAVLFGGKSQTFANNVVSGWGESCVFIGAEGDNWAVRGNRVEGGRMTDIVCTFVEGALNGVVEGNFISDCDGPCVSTGHYGRLLVSNNHGIAIADAARSGTFPFGPFSERVGYNAGTRPLAGCPREELDYNAITIVEAGAGDTNRPKRALISGNRISDHTAGSYLNLVSFSKGAANAIEGVSIVDNDFSDAAAMGTFDYLAATTCLNLNKPFIVSGNVARPDTHLLTVSAAFSRADDGTVQDFFDTPDKVALWAKSRYRFKGILIFTNGATSHNCGLIFTATNALTTFHALYASRNAAVNIVTATARSTIETNTPAISNFVSGSVNTRHCVLVEGFLITDLATVVTPQFQYSAVTGVPGVFAGANSNLVFTYDGPAGRVSVGDVT